MHGALRELGDNAIEKALALDRADPGTSRARRTSIRSSAGTSRWSGRSAAASRLNVVPDRVLGPPRLARHARRTVAAAVAVRLARWRRRARADGEVELVEVVEPFETSPIAVLAEALAGAVAADDRRATPAATGMVAWTDAHNFVDLGGSQAVVFGPGIFATRTAQDEFVSMSPTSSRALASLAALIAGRPALAPEAGA